MKHEPYGPYERFFKRPLDCTLSILALIILGPIILITALLVYLKLGRPVLFTQDRPGRNEKIFRLYKFRTMTDKRDVNGNLLPDAERLTRFGSLLRSTSLDELPELLNIAKGDMAIIGPRPLLVQYLPYYTESEKHRHDVRPGLSGLAQVNGRNLVKWDQRLAYDVEYVSKITFLGDIAIVLKTIKKVFLREDVAVDTESADEGYLDQLRGGAGEMNDLKTPYFMINKDDLDAGVLRLKNALQLLWPNYIIGYSYKTNALPWIIEYFKNHGCHAEVVSDDEYKLAESVGAEKIIYNGVAKSKETFLKAVRDHVIVNIDSEYEIDWLDELGAGDFEVGIRVNFDLESKCPGQTQCGEEGERFGFCYENGELKRAIDRIEAKAVKVIGIHLHKSSKTRMPDIYRAIAETAVEIAKKYEMSLSYVDIGGGFFGGLDWKPQFLDYIGMISTILREQFSPLSTTLIVEPGMALIGTAVDYVSQVLDVKRTTRNTFVVTDGSRTQIDPLMTKEDYFYEIVRGRDGERTVMERQIISGFTCMEHDRLFELKDQEQLLPGDQIIYHKVGAYTMCLSPLFIKWFPDVYVKYGGRIKKIRYRWDTADYKRGSIGEEV